MEFDERPSQNLGFCSGWADLGFGVDRDRQDRPAASSLFRGPVWFGRGDSAGAVFAKEDADARCRCASGWGALGCDDAGSADCAHSLGEREDIAWVAGCDSVHCAFDCRALGGSGARWVVDGACGRRRRDLLACLSGVVVRCDPVGGGPGSAGGFYCGRRVAGFSSYKAFIS